jgi:rod shape-determining protein MreB
MFATTDLYIDLGTANTLIYAKRHGFILNEPSVIALKHKANRNSQVFALGQNAKRMVGKNPDNLSVLRPLREGVIADFESTSKMLRAFLSHVRRSMIWLRPRMVISLPCQVTEFERRAVEEVGYELGAHKVHLLHEPVAAAIGANLPVLQNQGSMVVDIGGGTTEIAVISMGGIVTAQAVRIGGDNIDDAIISNLKANEQFLVGEQTAEKLKMTIGSEISAADSIEVGGSDLATFLPRSKIITHAMISPAIDGVVNEIIASIQRALQECPPEIVSDIAVQGIVLAGGGALIRGLKSRIEKEIGVPVVVAKDPLYTVAVGGARALENEKLFEALEHPK